MRQQLLSYALKYKGEYSLIKKAIDCNEEYSKMDYSGNYLTILDDEYPKELFDLENPPFVLFYVGDLSYLSMKKVCVIGSRKPSAYAYDACMKLIQSLDEDVVIVSGLARGVDSMAHECAMKLNRKTMGILGCGIFQVYPKENYFLYEELKKHHLILSEYPLYTSPLAHHFPMRNRLLAALSKTCYVVEATRKSGTMITANYALDLQREIVAFPYRYNDEFGKGCNELIQQGASVFLCDD